VLAAAWSELPAPLIVLLEVHKEAQEAERTAARQL
jgi:hypothetical protein